ncbi:MAG: hypothetical protein ACPKPY_09630 [Nitrososphaeraceae archaeon]
MKTKIITSSIAAILAVSLITNTNLGNQKIFAQETIEGTLTSPSGDNPFGGEDTGTIGIEYDKNNVSIMSELNKSPSEGMVFEGWLVDPDTGYKLSTGLLDENNAQTFEQVIVNPYIYNVYVVTEEPLEDVDPNANVPVGGFVLPSPFGQ